MKKPLTRAQEIARIRANPNQNWSIKLVAGLYAHSKRGSEEESFLYHVLLRRCGEETRGP